MSRKILIDPNAAIREMAATEKATNKTFLLSKTCFLVFKLGCVKKYKINIYFHKMVQLFVNYRRANSAKWPIFRAKLFASFHQPPQQLLHSSSSTKSKSLLPNFSSFRLLKSQNVRISRFSYFIPSWFYRQTQLSTYIVKFVAFVSQNFEILQGYCKHN